MEMSQIRYFIAVSETLNFTRAAERCCISQPALTKGIKKLESTIGGELFYRTRNTVALSELGRTLLPSFKQIYASAQRTEQAAHRLLNQERAIMRVGIQSNIDLGILLDTINVYRRQYPGVELTLSQGSALQLKEKYDHHELDIIFVSETVDKEHLFDNVIFNEPLVVIFGQDHRFNSSSTVSLKELAGERFCWREHCESSAQAVRLLSQRGIKVNIAYNLWTDDWLDTFLQHDNALAVVPLSTALKEGHRHRPISDNHLFRSVCITYKGESKQEMSGLLSLMRAVPEMLSLNHSSYGPELLSPN